MSATHQARGAGVRRPPRREHIPPYRPPFHADGDFQLVPPDEPRPGPPTAEPALKVRVEVAITDGDQVERFAARYVRGATEGPDEGCRIMRLRRLDDGAECRVVESWDGPVCDCADYTAADGCLHAEALVAAGLIEDLGRLAAGEGVGHG